MTRPAAWLLSAGVLLFIGVLASQGLPAVVATLALAGWGLVLVALFHLLPLALDAAAIRVLFVADGPRGSMARCAARALGGRIGQQPDAGRADRRPGADGASSGTARHAHAGRRRGDHGQHHSADLRADRFRPYRRCAAGRASESYFATRAAHLGADRQRSARAAGGGFYLAAAARFLQQADARGHPILRQARLVAVDEPGRSDRP